MVGAGLELVTSGFQVRRPNHSATLPPNVCSFAYTLPLNVGSFTTFNWGKCYWQVYYQIVSITKFSIVIGSPRSHIGVQLQVSKVSNFYDWIPTSTLVIRTSITRAGFLNASYSFKNSWKALLTFSVKRSSLRDLDLFLEICYRYHLVLYNSGSNRVRSFNSASCWSDFEIYSQFITNKLLQIFAFLVLCSF